MFRRLAFVCDFAFNDLLFDVVESDGRFSVVVAYDFTWRNTGFLCLVLDGRVFVQSLYFVELVFFGAQAVRHLP